MRIPVLPLLFLSFFISLDVSAQVFNFGSPVTRNCADEAGVVQCSGPMERNFCNDAGTPQPRNCCAGLVLDGDVCKDPSIHDPSLKRCSPFDAPTTSCGAGEGCLPGSFENLFDREDPTFDGDELEELEHLLETELESLGFDPKANGQSCNFHRDCESRFCNSAGRTRNSTIFNVLTPGTCAEQRICRRVEEDELAVPPAQCREGLIVGSDGKCYVDPAAVYHDLSDESVFRLGEVVGDGSEANQCRFDYPEESKTEGLKAIVFVRSLEWLLATISIPADRECLQLVPYLKSIGTNLSTARRALLEEFNNATLAIESDFANLVEAKGHYEAQTPNMELIRENSRGEPLTMHGEPINMRTLATRLPSGYDMLRILHRRNEAWLAYETAMADLAQNAHTSISDLHAFMQVQAPATNTWRGNSTAWQLPPPIGLRSGPNCRWAGFFGNADKKVKNRWRQRYKVDGNQSYNYAAVTRPTVAASLALINGSTPAQALLNFNSSHWLLDPLLPGDNLRFEDWGRQSLWDSLGKRRRFDGDGISRSYNGLRLAFEQRVRSYYQSLRPATFAAPEKFIYDPELVTQEARNCIDQPGAPLCEEFGALITKVTDVAFAQFLSYSRHNKSKYKSYFNNGGSWRRKLFAMSEVQLLKLENYYNELSAHRVRQNECVQRLIDRAQQNDDDDNETNVEVAEGPGTPHGAGETNYFENTGYQVNNPQSGPQATGPGATRGTLINAPNFNGVNRGNSVITGTNLGPTGASTGATTNAHLRATIEARSENLAARIKSLKDANARASARGHKILSSSEFASTKLPEEKKNSSGAGINTFSASPGASTAVAATSSSDEAKSGLEDDGKDKKEDLGTGKAITVGERSSGAAGSQSGSGAYSGIGSGSGYSDPTGMSNEEKDVVMANLERNRSSFNTANDDSLFDVISKTYVRNLEKILTRKRAE